MTLKKSDGSYLGGKTYNVLFEKDGFESRTVAITSAPNGWYIAGNLLFGGLIGWLIVDPLTGAMYNLSPDQLNAELGESVSTINNDEKSFTIVMIENVPAELLGEMELVARF